MKDRRKKDVLIPELLSNEIDNVDTYAQWDKTHYFINITTPKPEHGVTVSSKPDRVTSGQDASIIVDYTTKYYDTTGELNQNVLIGSAMKNVVVNVSSAKKMLSDSSASGTRPSGIVFTNSDRVKLTISGTPTSDDIITIDPPIDKRCCVVVPVPNVGYEITADPTIVDELGTNNTAWFASKFNLIIRPDSGHEFVDENIIVSPKSMKDAIVGSFNKSMISLEWDEVHGMPLSDFAIQAPAVKLSGYTVTINLPEGVERESGGELVQNVVIGQEITQVNLVAVEDPTTVSGFLPADHNTSKDGISVNVDTSGTLPYKKAWVSGTPLRATTIDVAPLVIGYIVNVTGGAHTAHVSGSLNQFVKAGQPIESVVFRCNDGYWFGDYNGGSNNSMSISLNDAKTEITLSGRPASMDGFGSFDVRLEDAVIMSGVPANTKIVVNSILPSRVVPDHPVTMTVRFECNCDPIDLKWSTDDTTNVMSKVFSNSKYFASNYKVIQHEFQPISNSSGEFTYSGLAYVTITPLSTSIITQSDGLKYCVAETYNIDNYGDSSYSVTKCSIKICEPLPGEEVCDIVADKINTLSGVDFDNGDFAVGYLGENVTSGNGIQSSITPNPSLTTPSKILSLLLMAHINTGGYGYMAYVIGDLNSHSYKHAFKWSFDGIVSSDDCASAAGGSNFVKIPSNVFDGSDFELPAINHMTDYIPIGAHIPIRMYRDYKISTAILQFYTPQISVVGDKKYRFTFEDNQYYTSYSFDLFKDENNGTNMSFILTTENEPLLSNETDESFGSILMLWVTFGELEYPVPLVWDDHKHTYRVNYNTSKIDLLDYAHNETSTFITTNKSKYYMWKEDGYNSIPFKMFDYWDSGDTSFDVIQIGDVEVDGVVTIRVLMKVGIYRYDNGLTMNYVYDIKNTLFYGKTKPEVLQVTQFSKTDTMQEHDVRIRMNNYSPDNNVMVIQYTNLSKVLEIKDRSVKHAMVSFDETWGLPNFYIESGQRLTDVYPFLTKRLLVNEYNKRGRDPITNILINGIISLNDNLTMSSTPENWHITPEINNA